MRCHPDQRLTSLLCIINTYDWQNVFLLFRKCSMGITKLFPVSEYSHQNVAKYISQYVAKGIDI